MQILEHGIRELIGTYQKGRGGYGFVIPDNQRITTDVFVAEERSKGAVSGHKVKVEILSYGDKDHKPEGKVDGDHRPHPGSGHRYLVGRICVRSPDMNSRKR